MVRACLTEMSAWTVVVITSLKAEFPDWQVLQWFQVMNAQPAYPLAPRAISAALLRIAHAFNLPTAGLVQSHGQVFELAKALRRAGSAKSNVDAWAHALKVSCYDYMYYFYYVVAVFNC